MGNLEYIFGRPNFFHAQAATQTTFRDRRLITAWEVSPFSQYQYGQEEDSQTLYLGSFAYASMMGTLWRGTINYDIMVVKTPYHQGRFAVVFLPETNISEVPEKLDNLLNTNYNVVCNLKDRQDEMGRTTFRVSVPFISNTDWRETYKRTNDIDNPGPDAKTLDTKTGCLAIYSLVDLSNPPTVSPSVTFFIAHSGGEDYQIARPVMNLAPGFQSKYSESASRYAQADIGTVFVPEDENLLIPSHTARDVTTQTTGEYFKSLRAFMKRYGLFANLSQNSSYVGLRTRHMSEDPKSGARTMSRTNFSDKVIPTPWYMTSFLSFDETIANQTVTPEAHSYGQPIFQQNQQVSNSFEVRTPYYRGIRCDVVDSNQIPVLGDVRTNIRCRNLANYGGDTQTSPMYEAAGDDFNYFFMVGPPPMCDIRNVRSTSTFPTGNTVKLDLTDVDAANAGDDYISFQPIGIEPAIEPSLEPYSIATGVPQEFFLPLADGSNIGISITDCKIEMGGSPFFRVKIDPKTVKLPDVQEAIKKLGTITVVTDAPLVE